MAGEAKVWKLLQRYRSIFLFLILVLLVQVFIALRLIFIVDNPGLDTQRGLPVDYSEHQQHRHTWHQSIESVDTEKLVVKGLQRNSAQFQEPSPSRINSSVQNTSKNSSSATSPQELDLNSLDFVPGCNIVEKQAISAISRAKTQECKKYLAETTCKLMKDVLYPKRLPRFCKNNGSTYMKYVGCFRDEKQSRLLTDHYTLQKETNSPGNCIDMCLQYGFSYAGVQYGVECFCGNTRPPESALLEPSECNMKCPSKDFTLSSAGPSVPQEERENTCGGYFTMSVYETGISRISGPEVIGLGNSSNVKGSANVPVRIVFFLTLNGRALRQVIRLIKILFHEYHYFYIHVDARQDYLFRELLALENKLPENVRFVRERMSTIWGGASLLKTLLYGMAELVNNSNEWGWNWDYVINLSESDFPLKTVEQLETFLTLNKGKNFLKSHGRDVQKFIQKQGLDKTFDECEFHMWRLSDRKLPAGILIDGGSDWVVLHQDFVKYIVQTDDELVQGLEIVFGYTLLPAESFFHTTLRNSPFCETFVDNNLRVTNWKRKLGCKCQYKNIVDWCGCSPNDFRLADWKRLEATEPRLLFFGRKFEAVVNQDIINKLESKLAPTRFQKNFATIDRYWQSIYHHQDMQPQPDDALLTLGSSLSRVATRRFAVTSFENLSASGGTESHGTDLSVSFPTNVHELNVYVHNNEVQGILIRFSIEITNEFRIELESWFSILSWVQYEPETARIAKYHSRIQAIRVGTDYDQKEQIFRNFAGCIGPMSEPALAYHVYSDEPLNITFVWSNPSHQVQAVNNFSVSGGETANFVKPALKMPLQPGNWTVKILSQEGSLIALVKFVVVPLQFYNGKPITPSQEKFVRAASEHNSDLSHYENNTSEDYWDWIDRFTSKFYHLQDTCIENEISPVGLQMWFEALSNSTESNTYSESNSFANSTFRINDYNILDMTLCRHTQWSSRYPDPKSTITGIDPITGLLLP